MCYVIHSYEQWIVVHMRKEMSLLLGHLFSVSEALSRNNDFKINQNLGFIHLYFAYNKRGKSYGATVNTFRNQ